jgi:GTP-binding protein
MNTDRTNRLPQVVIVGFPNAGKSTLFNKLLGERKALVHSLPGMTRDRVVSPCTLHGKRFELVDTGGFFDSHADRLSSDIKAKAWEAAQAADLLLYLLDGRRDLLPGEEELFRSMKKLGKPVLVVVNKIDVESQRFAAADYYRLGEGRIFFISAEHKINLDELEEAIADALPSGAPAEAAAGESRPLKIALVGRINVGKSSLANRLCGEERFIVSQVPGTTRDSSDVLILKGDKPFLLIDTAGIRKLARVSDERESAGVIKAKKNIPLADILCLVLDAEEFPTRQDTAVARLARDSGKPLVLVLNKWDLVRESEVSLAQVKDIVFQRLDFCSYAPLLTVSALTGKRVTQILDLAEKVYRNGLKRIGTSGLNKFLESVQKTNPPLSNTRKRFKIKYMTQKGVLPPTFVLFSSSPAAFSPSYEKYFIERLREKFGLWGTPIKLILRSS